MRKHPHFAREAERKEMDALRVRKESSGREEKGKEGKEDDERQGEG